MIELKKGEGPDVSKTLEAAIFGRLSAADRKFLLSTPEKHWPKIRMVFVGCEEAGDLVELIPEMNRVMRVCPAILLSRAFKGEITQDEAQEGYSQLHDSVHGVRNAQNSMLYLAGFRVPDPVPPKHSSQPTGDTPAAVAGTSENEGSGRPAPAGTVPKSRS